MTEDQLERKFLGTLLEASRFLTKWSAENGFLVKHGGGSNVYYTQR